MLFFFEGKEGLLRIALAILTTCEKELVQCRVLEEVIPFLLHLPKDKIHPGVLLPAVFRVEVRSLIRKVGVMPSDSTTDISGKSGGSLFGFMNNWW